MVFGTCGMRPVLAALVVLLAVLGGCATSATPSDAVPRCGDGNIEGDEVCDDGNVASRDGCSAQCNVETGFTCGGEPSTCRRTEPEAGACGDGVIAGREVCDDGNRVDGDGCSALCLVEPRYTCVGQPSVCSPVGPTPVEPICGDGRVDAPETCDDGGTIAGDGCGGDCRTELGYVCTGAPSVCSEIVGTAFCGNGIVETGETCDDGDATAADGCSATCQVEDGYTCAGAPSVCSPIPPAPVCGDGQPAGTEACDDGNVVSGDGCSATCTIETGYTCAGTPSVCTPPVRPCGTENCALLDGPCVRGACEGGTCVARTVSNGTTCDDGSLCTSADRCTNGVCAGAPVVCEGGACADATCDPATGACSVVPRDDGAVCALPDGGPCVAGFCEAGDCVATPVDDGVSCDTDLLDCSSAVCVAGACQTTTLDDCTACGAGGALRCAGGACGGRPTARTETFSAPGLPAGFSLPTTRPWQYVASGGRAGGAWRSGSTGNNQTSSLFLDITVPRGGTVAFWYRTDTESCCDKLQFFRGTTRLLDAVSGTWTRVEYPLPAGSHRLEWRYSKDGSFVNGADAVWIDDVEVLGEAACTGDDCSLSLFDGTDCVTCALRDEGDTCALTGDNPCQTGICEEGGCTAVALADGTSCDTDATDCGVQTCQAGACVVASLPDCTTCGTGGTNRCANGTCGGPPPVRSESFDTPGLPPGFTGSSTRPWSHTTTGARSGGALRSAATGDSETSSLFLDAVLVAPGNLSFWYRADTESCCDQLRFFVNGTQRFAAAPTTWTPASYDLPAGTYRFEWRYTKDLNTARGADAVWIDDFALSGVAPCQNDACGLSLWNGVSCTVCPIQDDGVSCDGDVTDCTDASCEDGRCVEQGREECAACGSGADVCVAGACGGTLPTQTFGLDNAAGLVGFTSSGAQPWRLDTVERFAGAASVRSGNIGHNARSSMHYTVNAPVAGEVRFRYRTSTENTYDWLRFRINGAQQLQASGSTAWTEARYPLLAGVSALEWAYEKDRDTVAGSDAVWVDEVTFVFPTLCGSTACAPSGWDGETCLVCPATDPTCE